MQISEAESVVMAVLWRGSPRSAEEVIAELSRDQHTVVGAVIAVLRADFGAREVHRDGHERQPIHRLPGEMSENTFATVHVQF